MKCCLCNKHYVGFKNNAKPIMSGGCCEECYDRYVLPVRAYEFFKSMREKCEKQQEKQKCKKK
jgi:hypothetical protein